MGIKNEDQLTRWYMTTLRVRYQETDQMGVVYHVNYLNWFEIGRTEMIRQLGLTYRSIEEEGVYLPVTELDIQYKQPAHYDDEIAIFTRITAFSKLRIKYDYEIHRLSAVEREVPGTLDLSGHVQLPGALLVTGTTSHVWVSREWQPVRLDKCAPKLYEELEKSIVG